MFRLLLRPALLLTLLAALPIFLIRAQPYDDSELRAFLVPPEGCPAPCFMGIRPGVTTVDEAIAILEAHEWITNIQLEVTESAPNYGRLTWNWREVTPDYIDRHHQSSVTLMWKDSSERTGNINRDVFVGTIQIFTNFPMYTVEQVMGKPDSGTARLLLDNRIAYTLSYNLKRSTRSTLLGFMTFLPCPADLLTYWKGRTEMYETVWLGTDRYIPPNEVVKAC